MGNSERTTLLKGRVAEALEYAEDRYFGSGEYVGSIIDLTRLRMHLIGYAIEYGTECVKKGRWRSNYAYLSQGLLERMIERRLNFYREKIKK